MIKKIFIILSLLIYSCGSLAEPDFDYFTSRQIDNDKSDFIDYMVEQYNFDRNYLSDLIFEAKYLPEVLQKITAAKTDQNIWELYHKLFVNDKRALDGCRYWQRHNNALAYAQKHFGVDPSIIVAIVGVETDYGTKQGNFSVLDALNTLAFYYPPRSTFFKSE